MLWRFVSYFHLLATIQRQRALRTDLLLVRFGSEKIKHDYYY